MSKYPKFLNLGCGSRYSISPEWLNVDFHAIPPYVRSHDLQRDFPFPDESFEVVYHSHVLEHFPRSEAVTFLRECRRVLCRRGLLRVAVPDFEAIVRQYLVNLENAKIGNSGAAERYEWTMLELYDQVVRVHSTGRIIDFLQDATKAGKEYAATRWGLEARHLIARANTTPIVPPAPRPLWKRIISAALAPNGYYEKLIKMVLGREYSCLQVGRFRSSGEIHQWMYDAFSLQNALLEAGFASPRCCGAAESQLPKWTEHNLDTEPDGQVYKPDSLYMESVKP